MFKLAALNPAAIATLATNNALMFNNLRSLPGAIPAGLSVGDAKIRMPTEDEMVAGGYGAIPGLLGGGALGAALKGKQGILPGAALGGLVGGLGTGIAKSWED